jgi:hypothetical protein
LLQLAFGGAVDGLGRIGLFEVDLVGQALLVLLELVLEVVGVEQLLV